MTIRPLPGKVLVEPDPVPTETASGLTLVRDWNPLQSIGTVRAAGARAQAAVGQRVLFAANSGYDVKVDDRAYLLLNDGDIVAVVEDHERRTDDCCDTANGRRHGRRCGCSDQA